MRTSALFCSVSHQSFFVLRSPLLSISQLSENLAQIADGDRLILLERLLRQPQVFEALYLASPTLLTETESWLNESSSFLPLALESALWKYLLRMSSRCTPFGLFAGYAVGQITDHTAAELASDPVRATTRLDRTVMGQLVRRLTTDAALRRQLRYRLNNSLYRAGQSYRYSEYVGEGNKRTVQLASVEDTEGLRAIMAIFGQTAETNEILYGDLVRAVEALDHQQADAEGFVDALVDAQLLVSELEPGATGPLRDERVFNLLQPTGQWADVSTAIAIIRENTPSLSSLQHLQTTVENLPIGLHSVKCVVQTDANWRTTKTSLSQSVVEQIGTQLTQLMPLRGEHLTAALTTFRNRFYERFGEQSIPLLIALDPDMGVGYGNSAEPGNLSLLNGLAINNMPPKKSSPADRLDAWRLKKFAEALHTGQEIMAITDEDLIEINRSAPTTSPACSWYAHGMLLGESSVAVDKGDYQFLLRTAAGPSALNLLGRFSTDDESLTEHLCQLADWEQQQYPDVVLAEIVHLPTDRIGNVVSRPTLRPYEIPYLTTSSVDDAHTIFLNDLMVTAPRGQEILLYSKRLGKRVIPRLSTAHNFHQGDDVYRFLCDLQHHDQTTQLSWSWGSLHDQPTLPRVVFQHIILARAQWSVRRIQVSTNVSATHAISQLKSELHLPRWVALIDGDNELVLDLDVPICQRLLWDELAKRETIKLVEWLAVPDQCWVRQNEHRFTSEVVIPFGYQRNVPLPSYSAVRQADTPIQRFFPPGSEWLYVKVYASEGVADELITAFAGPLATRLLDTQLINNWFFVRYADPEPHLRLRFHCPNQTYSQVLDQFNASLARIGLTHLVQRIQLDTYEREVERYGYLTVEHCEALFGIDSQLVVTWLTNNNDSLEDGQRWLFACQRVDALLTDFSMALSEKIVLLRHLQQAYQTEHGGSKELRRQLNDLYRQWAGKIINTFNNEASRPMCDVAHAIKLVLAREQAGATLLSTVLTSIVHMAMNRIFQGRQRQAELVVYHFMARHYESVQARQGKEMALTRKNTRHSTE